MIGMSARVFHCPLISSSPYMHLAAVVERKSNKSKDMYPWINILRSTDDLFSDSTIDLVVITTPNGSHYSLALEAMKNGKNGKPLNYAFKKKKC
jgi:scyllo-inositol 2-dehydrogenase (NADP+)